MKKLTQKEEEVMQALWELDKAFVKEIIDLLPPPKPHYNTVSTIIQKLKSKGFVGYESFGNSHRYYPLVSKEKYQKKAIGEFIKNYFDNSYQNMVAFFAKEEKITDKDLEEVIDMIKNKKS